MCCWWETQAREDSSKKLSYCPRNGWSNCWCLQWQTIQQCRNQVWYDRKVCNEILYFRYLGEFALSYKPTRHGKPGVGATKGSSHTDWDLIVQSTLKIYLISYSLLSQISLLSLRMLQNILLILNYIPQFLIKSRQQFIVYLLIIILPIS